ncbi:hypothetical protein MTO96_026812 [Rhipicephalus appendiculatus]
MFLKNGCAGHPPRLFTGFVHLGFEGTRMPSWDRRNVFIRSRTWNEGTSHYLSTVTADRWQTGTATSPPARPRSKSWNKKRGRLVSPEAPFLHRMPPERTTARCSATPALGYVAFFAAHCRSVSSPGTMQGGSPADWIPTVDLLTMAEPLSLRRCVAVHLGDLAAASSAGCPVSPVCPGAEAASDCWIRRPSCGAVLPGRRQPFAQLCRQPQPPHLTEAPTSAAAGMKYCASITSR